MRLRCECGREFEAPDGAEQAVCPACGRTVRAGGADWLSALDAEDLKLDAEEARAPAPAVEEAPPPGPAPIEAERPAPSLEPPPGPQPMPGEPEEAEPRGLFAFLAVVREEPFRVMGLFRRGLRGSRFLAELVISTGALASVWAYTSANLAGEPGIVTVAGQMVRFIVELGAAGVLVALFGLLLKRDPAERPHPLGVAEGVAFTRLLGLAVAVPLGITVAVAVPLLGGPEHAPHLLVAFGPHVKTLYSLVVFGAQTCYIMGLLDMGCLPGVMLSVLVSYAADTLAGG